MKNTPPFLRPSSAERMQDTVALADQHVDSGMNPDAAIAKAASDLSLPFEHIPLVVRAFNTARAVQQLSNQDVWTKAASYPVASVPGVNAILTHTEKQASKAPKVVDDYTIGPKVKLPPQPKLPASIPAVPQPAGQTKAASVNKPADNQLDIQFSAAKLFDKIASELIKLSANDYSAVRVLAHKKCPSTAEFVFSAIEADSKYMKRASVQPSLTVTNGHPILNYISELEAIKNRYTPTTKLSVPDGYKKIASEGGMDLYRKLPDDGKIKTPILDMLKKSDDIAPGEDKPVMGAGGKEKLLTQFPLVRSKGLNTSTGYKDPTVDVSEIKPDDIIASHLTDLSWDSVNPATKGQSMVYTRPGGIHAAPIATVKRPPLLEEGEPATPKPDDSLQEGNAPTEGSLLSRYGLPAAALGGGGLLAYLAYKQLHKDKDKEHSKEAADEPKSTWQRMLTPFNAVRGIPGMAPLQDKVVDALAVAPERARERSEDHFMGELGNQKQELGKNLDAITLQQNMQSLLEDPRFGKTDPGMVIRTYQQLRQIAPAAMSNPAIAADYIHRRILTGPPSYFDLEALSRIEANLSKARRDSSPRIRDDDDD